MKRDNVINFVSYAFIGAVSASVLYGIGYAFLLLTQLYEINVSMIVGTVFLLFIGISASILLGMFVSFLLPRKLTTRILPGDV